MTNIYRPAINTGTAWPIARRPERKDPQFLGTVNLDSKLLRAAVWAERSKPDLRVADIMNLQLSDLVNDKVDSRFSIPRFVRTNGEARPRDPAFYAAKVTTDDAAYSLSVWVNIKVKEEPHGVTERPYLSFRFTRLQPQQQLILLG
jgi:hypothetical protein